MPKSQVDSVALIAAALAATLALTLLLGSFAWMGSIVGIILLLLLFGFDQEGYRTVLGSLGFSAVCGLCFAVASGAVLKLMGANGEVHLADERWASEWMPFVFVFGTAFLWAIDRSRMSARQPIADRLAAHPGAGQRGFISYAESAPAPPPPRPLVQTPAPPPSPSATSLFESQTPYQNPAPAPPPAYAAATAPEPIPQPRYSPPPPAPEPPPQPMYAPPPPVAEPAPLMSSARPQSMLTHTTTEPARPAPVPILPRGKETMIYINLMGEGLNLMRSVTAEHLGRDFYRITDTMPEGETWQFQPGQVVRCKKQNLSTGKAMVAYEEAPRAQ